MSTNVYLSNASNDGSLPTLGELRAQIRADEALPAARRRDMASAIMAVCKATGRPPEIVPASPVTLRPLLSRMTAAMAGQQPRRWRNVLSLLADALDYAGIITVPRRIDGPPSAAWLAILKAQPLAQAPHFHLWRFARYCTLREISPDRVDDAVIAAYQDDLEHRSMVAEPERAARDAARFWNEAAKTYPAWSQRLLTVPDNRQTYAPPLDSYPESLRQDIAAWTFKVGDQRPSLKRDFRPLRATSMATRLRQLRLYLAALIHQGVKVDDLISLAAAVTPERAELGLTFFWERADRKPSHHAYQIAGLVLSIARHWARLDHGQIEEIRNLANQLRPKITGMSSRNMARLRQLDRSPKFIGLVQLPRKILEEVRRAGEPTATLAQKLQTAVALGIELSAPVRIRTLHHVRIGVELIGGKGQPKYLSVTGEGDTKNDVPLEMPLPAELSAMLDLYIEHYRPLLSHDGGDWLFPGARTALPKTADGLRSQMQLMLAKRCGLVWHPHLFRHLCAWIILRDNPQAYGMVQRLLSHKRLSTTIATYSGLEMAAAIKHYDRVVSTMCDAAQPNPRKSRKGNGP